MLENIKLMLGLNDNSKDELIESYISKVEIEIMAFCNMKVFDTRLNSFIENKVVKVMNPNSQVKSKSRGDTNITYVTDNEYSIGLTDSDKNYLKPFRRCLTW